ncbi:dormancy-associated protein homolog 3-like protein isoform X1 [Tanacetum coccineum]
MSLLDQLWDDTVAGPPPDKGLGKLRKQSTFTFRSSDSGKGGRSEAFRFRRKSASDAFEKASGIGTRSPRAPYDLAKGSKPGKNQSRAKRGTGKKRLARKDFCGLLLRLTQTDEEAVKESEKEYIGMVKICYEGAQRSKQERPGEDVVGNSRGTAWIKEPQAFAKISVEVGDALDRTPRKKSTTARDLVLVWKATWKRQPRRTRGELEEQDLNN